MNAHVLLNLLNKLRKKIKCEALLNILSLLCNKFNKFNITGAQMSDSIYHMTLKFFQIMFFGVKMARFCHYICHIMDIIT